jgi:trigger factor
LKVSTTEVPPRQVALDIEVEPERLERATASAVQRFAGQVNIPGFRRGKAPRAMVERYVGRDRIVEDALDHLLPVVVDEAIKQEGVEPYTTPRVESVEFDPLRLRAVVPLAPNVTLGGYATDLRITPEEVKVDPEQVQGVINRLRESNAQWVPVERPAEIGDRVGLNVQAQVVEIGRQLLDTKDAEFVLNPEGAEPAPGFSNAIVGMSAGEQRTFNLPLPEEDRDPEKPDEQVEFNITVHWVKAKELPAVDDAFAQSVGDYPDVAALTSSIEAQIRQREQDRIETQTQEQALDKLVEISTVEYPPQIVDHEADHLVENYRQSLQQQGIPVQRFMEITNQTEETLRASMREDAERRVRRSLVLGVYAEQEGIDADDAEIDAEIQTAAAGAANPERTAAEAIANADTRDRVRGMLRERKALSQLISLATSDGAAAPETGDDQKKDTAEAPEADTDAQAAAESTAETAPSA